MKKFVRSSSMVAMAATAILMCSCSKNFDFYDPAQNVADEYAKGWQEAFGDIDSNQDWNLATQKTVNITVDGTKTVQILTGNPYLNEGKLAGEFTVNNQLSAKVDLTKDTEVIYAVQRNENGKKDVKTTYISEDGTFNVDFTANASATRAATRAGSRTATELSVTRNNFLELVMYYASEEWNIWDFNNIVNDYMTNSGTRQKIAFNSWGDKYFDASDGSVSNSTVYVDKTLKDAVNSIIPENQKSSYYNTIIQDVDLVVSETGPVTLTLLSATTSNQAAIGYYIYTDKTVNNEAVTAPSNYPTKDFLINGGYNSEWNKYYTYVASTRVVTDQQKLADKMIIIPNVQNIKPSDIYWGEQTGGSNCKQVKLLYKDPTTGEYSEDFPKGTKIAFFVVPNANASSTSIDASRTVFSFADMNVDAHKSKLDSYYYSNFSNDTYSSSHAATFKVQDKIIIGFEDAGSYSSQDFDYNDCVFVLDGNFEEEIIPDPIPEEDPEENSWIIACEDLGDTDDYDFNDVVFKVTHVSGEETATVTPLAAGGVLETWITHNSSDEYIGETHQLLGAQASSTGNYPMINTSKITATGTPRTVNVGADFSIAENMGGFGIIVKAKSGDTNATVITAPTAGTAPQMICVPDTWAWPTERTKIQDAYPDFANWSANSNNIEWYKNANTSLVIGGSAE
ncbi:MAG: LruC domain-containing protein [Prevotella sp.]